MNRVTLSAAIAVLAATLPGQDNGPGKKAGKESAVVPAAFKVVDYQKKRSAKKKAAAGKKKKARKAKARAS